MSRARAPAAAALAAILILLGRSAPAAAGAPTLFGSGARSAGLARSDIATADPTDAPVANSALAAQPGLRLRVGYGYGWMGGLLINDESAGVLDASGFTFASQLGVAVSPSVTLGAALAVYIPDASLARLSFRPATEPQFILYESPLQRTGVDMVVAIRYRSLSIGGGASLSVSVGGEGTRFDLKQDALGTRADATADVALPYRATPVFGARLGVGRSAFGASFRGSSAIDLHLDSESLVALTDNPLNGTTTVEVSGTTGYEPASIDIGASLDLGAGFTAHAALEVALYSAAPPPVADVSIDVRLGTVPSQREVRFIEPRLRDTVSPRIAVELKRPSLPEWRWAARAGYVFAPSPVPRQTGFTSYADADRHGISIGGGYHIGEAFGVDLSANLALAAHLLADRAEEKPNPSLPHATYTVGGSILYGSASLEAAWR